MEFEAETPACRAFAARGDAFENFVLLDAAIVTDRDESCIDKADPATALVSQKKGSNQNLSLPFTSKHVK